MKETLHWLQFQHIPIQKQLALEEKLLRFDDRNFCLVNVGSPRAIVMGISGKEELLINQPLVQKDPIPILRRFSGGGTVVIDEETLFVTFIFSKKSMPFSPYPEPIMRWSAEVYEQAWKIPGFALKENDYVIYDRKCGGNAQYIQKNRWLHHTSFLWNFQPKNMDYLLLPPARPQYRKDRAHLDFLRPMQEQVDASLGELIASLHLELVKRFYITTISLECDMHLQK